MGQGADGEAEVLLEEVELLPDESGKRRISLPPPVPEQARMPRPPTSRPPPLPLSRRPPAEMAPGSLPPPTATLPPMPAAPRLARPESGVRPLAPPPAGVASIPAPAGAGTLPPKPAASRPPSSPPAPSAAPAPRAATEVLQEKLAAAHRELAQAQEQRNRLLTRLMETERRVQSLQAELKQRDARIAELQAGVARAPDDLKRIQGIGASFEERLHAEGIERFAQIAEWTLADLERLAPRLKTTPGRIMRDSWVEQAQALVAAQASR